ncbi:ABC-type nitrate/sulfonate/bicarbonate transport system ATPase subunit [Paenibacillus shirakamiensis]|uniref:ABC-type nitrate/sulfonate/bicarbonate transport system ATPase subunit n=1 Tax=Paenibacillus shirakamiensis TaxID=1265935 RepID=A0ABS4JIQ9_9BACL|nr:ABC transporter ATP-binding protein [Paenibacillus shirakamiensis]MBP2001594.1 ABC-type nitrate/sulfonate/bicarbonate transport system ATPase subunit [Paenibacillus shirakamiensis]
MHNHPRSPVSASLALDIQDISKTFKQKKQHLQVLDAISLQVHTGEFVSIVGPSGSGKSTLFHIIGGLTAPDHGSIRLHDQDITGQKGHISYVPQQPALFPWRTIEDNVILALEVAGVPLKEARQEAAQWLERAGLADFRQAYPQTLSGGMQQRVAFLRGLISRQELMLLDEPFSALDAFTRSDMQRWLLDIWEENRRSVLFITHNIEEALLLSDTIYLFSSRPARPIHQLHVPFSRPRSEDIIEDPEFRKLKKQLSHLMREEQQKGMDFGRLEGNL